MKTMRQKFAAANWKMNLNMSDALQLAGQIAGNNRAKTARCKIILAPSYPYLPSVAALVKDNHTVLVAAQDCSAHAQGAFTGEVSAMQIQSAGASYVIIGHSERRTYHQEKSELLLKKMQQALTHDLSIIFCCGETLEERNAQRHFETVKQQLAETVFKLKATDISRIIIAYEPVWAIGTGVNATAAQAQEMHQFIRQELNSKFGTQGSEVSILYGGSCNEKNAAELFAQPDIDGGLIGGASLKAESFLAIVSALG